MYGKDNNDDNNIDDDDDGDDDDDDDDPLDLSMHFLNIYYVINIILMYYLDGDVFATDCGGKVCYNGGKLDVTRCSCKCSNRPWIDRDSRCARKSTFSKVHSLSSLMCNNDYYTYSYCF